MTIRDIDDQFKASSRIQTALYRRSTEDEACNILHAALSVEPVRAPSLVDAIRAHIVPVGSVDLVLPEREPIREPSVADGQHDSGLRAAIRVSANPTR